MTLVTLAFWWRMINQATDNVSWVGIEPFLVQVAVVLPMGLALIARNNDQREKNEKLAATHLRWLQQ